MKTAYRFIMPALFSMNVFAAPVFKKATDPVAHLQFSSDFILQQVLLKKNLPLQSALPKPSLFLESKTPLKNFQDAIEPQWGFRPDVFTNAYVFKKNEIYLMDEASYYAKNHRCIDDSLAHELTHYVQVQYQNADLNDESLEAEAVDVQTWFRETFCKLPARRR